MMDEIPRDEPDAILRANDSFKLSPLGFQLFLALHLFAFRGFLEIPVDRWTELALAEKEAHDARCDRELDEVGILVVANALSAADCDEFIQIIADEMARLITAKIFSPAQPT